MLYIITSLTAVVVSILIILWMNKREKKRQIQFAWFLRHQFNTGESYNKSVHDLYQEFIKSRKKK